jgi:hypothetical protein
VLPTLLCVALLAAQAGSDKDLEAAIYCEVVTGDLHGAIQRYRAILSRTDTPKPVAARALLGIGHCQEKLGERSQAHDSYARLVRDFESETSVAAEARTRLANWTEMVAARNLNFDEGEVGAVPPGWFVTNFEKTTGTLAGLRRTGCRSKIGCVVLIAPATSPGETGNLMQSFSAVAYRGKTVRLRAWLLVESGAPGDRAQMFLHVWRPNRTPGFFKDLDQRAVEPPAEPRWTPCEITGRIDDDAQFLDFGFFSVGRGRVWIDNVSFEVVPDKGTQ